MCHHSFFLLWILWESTVDFTLFLLLFYFDLSRNKWAPSNGLTGHNAKNSVKMFLFFRTSKQFHVQENLETLLGLGNTVPKQLQKSFFQCRYVSENVLISSYKVYSSTRYRLAQFQILNGNKKKHKYKNYTEKEGDNPKWVFYRNSIITASIII